MRPKKPEKLSLNEAVALSFACGGDVFLKAEEAGRLVGLSRTGFEQRCLDLGIYPVDLNDRLSDIARPITRNKRYSLRQILKFQEHLIKKRDERAEEIKTFIRDAIENL